MKKQLLSLVLAITLVLQLFPIRSSASQISVSNDEMGISAVLIEEEDGSVGINSNDGTSDYRKWAQGDSRWGNLRLGASSDTVAKSGCTVTAVTKLIIQAGLKDSNSFNVATLVNWMNDNGGFTNQGWLVWAKPAAYSGLTYTGALCSEGSYSSSGNNGQIITWINQGYHIVLKVKNGTHWVAVDEAKTLSTGTVHIMDSLSNSANADITLDSRYPTFQIAQSYKGGSTPSVGSEEYVSECTPYPCAVKIKITEDCCPYTQPCNPTTASELGYTSEKLTSKPISKDEVLTADALYENTEGNYWYHVTLSDGTKAYLYSTHTTRSSIIYPWVDGGSFPSSITGTTNLQGTVTTGGSRLDTVQALVCRQGTTSPVLKSEMVTVNATTYPLKSSTVDKTTVFGNLSNYGSGYYTLMIDTAFTTYYAENNQRKSAALCDYAATYDFYYGQATVPNITITFNANGGTCSTANKVIASGSAVGALPTATRSGYTFDGWYTSASGGSKVSASTTFSSNTTVYAHWSANSYTVSYNANGGSGAPSSQTATVGNYIDLSWEIPTRFGYSFQGWATDSSASSVVYWPGDVYTDDTSITLYAVWREAEVLSGDTVGQFGEIAYINCPDAGVYYAFIPNTSTEYRIMSESDEDVCVDLFDANGNLIASDDDSGDGTNFLLTFNFTANETYYIYVRYYSSSLVGTIDFKVSKRYFITYDANGGTGAPETQYHFYDEAVTLSNKEPTRPGYIFVGWSTSNTAVNPDYLPGDIYSGSANLTLYAVWQSDPNYKTTYTVSYNANGGSGAPSEQCETIGTSLVLSSEIPTRFGYNFEGWSTSSAASHVSNYPGDVYTGESSITLYAVWEEAEIIVDDNIGHFYELDQIYFPDAGIYNAFIPDVNAVYRIEGHNSEDTKVYLYSADGTLLASDDDSGCDGDFLLTYEFTANETYYIYTRFSSNLIAGLMDFEISRRYSVIYDANGGTGAPETQYHFYDESVSMSAKEPTRPGYFFVGWAESSDATDPQYFLHASFWQNADLVLYAVWKTELSIIDSGICGIDLVWKLTNDGCLTISGTGAMFDFEEFGSPWSEYIMDIKCVVIEQGATSIGEYAFQPCLYLTNVQISDSVSSIGAFAFMDCSSLSELVLPSGLTNIGMYAFSWCSSLSSITIPGTVKLIADSAFSCCDNLEQITFKGNAPIFEEDVFYNVTAEAYYPSNRPTWTADVMQDYGGTIAWIPYQAMSFTDVAEGAFYYDPVMWAIENSITNGTSATTFGPNEQCMRAHVVTFLWRAMGSPEPKLMVNPFVDVKPSDFYYTPVLWALENGITSGMDATHFGPTAYCNRAQVVTFLYRTMGSPAVDASQNPFTDVAAGSFYEKPVLWAVENGITNGMSATTFGPSAICNRAQIVTFLYRAFN